MSFVNFPYRWTLRTWRDNVSHAWSDILGGICNVFIWLPIIWNDRWYDSDYIIRILEFKLKRMSCNFKHYGCHVGAERDARNMMVCVHLCNRILKDKYGFNDDYELSLYFKNNRSWLNGRKRDTIYLSRLLGKYLLVWWD